uniref:Uncharacterized protein n=1 Tax=Avena sativa TaxID=4498 RepID=A0ACD5ZEM3_AVESA
MVTFSGDVPPLVSHSAHPKHALMLVTTGGAVFKCDGCRQMGGDERRYRCEQCDFDLHICCARAPVVIEPYMFKGRTLTFFYRPPATSPAGCVVYCDVCGDQVLGFMYHSQEHDLDLHPCCAVLPERIVEDEGRVLDLHEPTGHSCGLCGQVGHRGGYLCYRLRHHDGRLVYFHVACVMDANYGSDGQAVQANSASMATGTGQVVHGRPVSAPPPTGQLQNGPRRRTSSSFSNFLKVAVLAARVTHAVTTMDADGIATAVTDSADLLVDY